MGARQAADRFARDGDALGHGAHGGENFTDPVALHGQSDDFADARAGRGRGVEAFAEENDRALRRRVGEHRFFVGDDALEEARVQLVQVGADDDEQVGAVAGFGQRRHHPAAGLEHAEIAVLAFAQGVIDDAAGLFGRGHDGAHAFDVGAEAAENGKSRFADQLGGGGDGFGERRVLAGDLGLRPVNLPLEAEQSPFRSRFS